MLGVGGHFITRALTISFQEQGRHGSSGVIIGAGEHGENTGGAVRGIILRGGFTMVQESNHETSGEVMTRLTGLQVRVEALEKRTQQQRGRWIERVMYWLIIIGLVVAVNLLAEAG